MRTKVLRTKELVHLEAFRRGHDVVATFLDLGTDLEKGRQKLPGGSLQRSRWALLSDGRW